MQNDDNTENTELEIQNQETEAVEETVVEDSEDSSDESNDAEAELAQARNEAAKYKRLFEKATTKPQASQPRAPQQASPQPDTAEVVILDKWIEKGVPNAEELMESLKKVAQVNNLTLLKAQNDPIFVAVKEKFEKDKKQESASMPASRSSGTAKPKKDFATPGLSREDHRAMLGL